MKIVCISDTHMKHGSMDIPDGDILIHAGDMTRRGHLDDIAEVNKWLGTLPHKHKVIIAGNHDFGFETNHEKAVSLITNATYLQDSQIDIDGISIYGSPWQPTFHNWAFNIDRGKLHHKWKLIPEGLDILVTHGPPFHILDKVMKPHKQPEHVGCKELKDRILEMKKPPVYHIFGHIHEARGRVSIGMTTFINAAMCDIDYKPINKAVEFYY